MLKRIASFALSLFMFMVAGHAQSSVVKEPAKTTPVLYDVDVCVVGGGLSGAGAAIAAARNGARTVVIEKTGYLGGWFRSVGLANVLAIPGWRPNLEDGLLKDITTRIAPYQAKTAEQMIQEGQIVTENYEAMSHVLLGLAREAGVEPLFFTVLAGVGVKGGKIDTVIVQTPVNRFAVRARIFIDCTGLATLAEMAGAPTRKEASSMGLASVIEGVDAKKFEDYLKTRPAKASAEVTRWFYRYTGYPEGTTIPHVGRWLTTDGQMFGEQYMRAVEAGEIKLVEFVAPRSAKAVPASSREAIEKGHGLITIHEGIKVFENPLLGGVARPRTYVVGVDVTDYQMINQAHILSEKMLFDYGNFLKKYVPGFENAQVSRLADATFNRAGRSIDGDFRPNAALVETDFKADDAVAVLQRGEDKGIFEVPYRTLLPEKIVNLLAVGKSSTGGGAHRLHSLSVIHGQVAGTAAALCVRQRKLPRELELRSLQSELKKQGIELPN